jgi:hypothetical protein
MLQEKKLFKLHFADFSWVNLANYVHIYFLHLCGFHDRFFSRFSSPAAATNQAHELVIEIEFNAARKRECSLPRFVVECIFYSTTQHQNTAKKRV